MLKSIARLAPVVAGAATMLHVGLASAANSQPDAVVTTGGGSYAKELQAAGTYTGLGATGDIGFGVSQGQTVFVRYNLSTNAKFTNLSAGSLTADTFAQPIAPNPNMAVTVAQGGNNQSFVIFQITANVNIDQFDDLILAGVGVTTSDTNPVTLSYALYGSGPGASSQSASNKLAGTDSPLSLITYAPAVSQSVEGVTSIINVGSGLNLNDAYTSFVPAPAFAGGRTARINGYTLVSDPASKKPNGTAVAFNEIVASTTVSVIPATPLPAGSTVKVTSDPNCGIGQVDVQLGGPQLNPAGAYTGTLSAPGLNGYGTLYTCVTVGGNVAIEENTFKFNVTHEAAVGANVSEISPKSFDSGSWVRNGTVIRFPFFPEAAKGVQIAVTLTNFGSQPAPFKIECFSKTSDPTSALFSAGVPSKRTVRLTRTAMGCSDSAQSAVVTVNAPIGSVVGSMSRVDATTGNTAYDAGIAPPFGQ